MNDLYYNKEGKVISFREWGKLFRNPDYKIIKQENLPNGNWLSTVWLGLNDRFGDDGPPLIFETMIFGPMKDDGIVGGSELDVDRYSTLEEALVGHKKMFDKWNK